MKQKKLKFSMSLLIATIVSTQIFAQWQNVLIPGFSYGGVINTKLAFNSAGEPYVAFTDLSVYGKATVMKYNGTNWSTVGSSGITSGFTNDVSLAINSAGEPFLAYQDPGNSNKVTVKKYNGSSWVTVGSAGFSPGQADYISLAINSAGEPFVAFRDFQNSAKATVMKFNGSSWIAVGSAGFSASTVEYTSLALNSAGEPYVAYKDGGNSNKATVMKYDGSAWVTLGSAGFSTGTVDYTSLALNNTGVPYVAYRDGGNSSKATVMKYIISCPISLTSATNSDNQILCVNTPINNITYFTSGHTNVNVTGLPPGVNFSFINDTVTISGIPTSSGTYNYTVLFTGGICTDTTATGTITVNSNNTITLTSASSTNNQTVCNNTAITNITYSSTGATGASFSGLPPGVTGSYSGGNIVISGIPTQDGTFSYIVTLNGGCGTTTSSGTITVNNCLGISEPEKEYGLHVYPNPTSIYLNIAINKSGVLEVYGIDGKVIEKINITNNNYSLDVRNYAQGVYMLRLIANDGMMYQSKFIKE